MNKRIVLTMIAPDQPGLVEKVSQVIVDHDGSWLASRMSHLDGMFAGILSVSVEDSKQDSLVESLYKLESIGIKLIVEQSNNQDSEGETHLVTITGSDRPGIVNEISSVLAREAINVEELVSDCVSAPMSGEILFQAKLSVELPNGKDPDDLSQCLEAISDDIIVDLA